MDKNVSTPHRNIFKQAEIIPYVIKSKQINSGNLRNSGGTLSHFKNLVTRKERRLLDGKILLLLYAATVFENAVYNFRSKKIIIAKIKYCFL